MDSPPQRREIHFGGTVQGVGFRYTTRAVAARFAVAGFVENLPDGRVRVVVQGTAAEIDRFLAAIESELGEYIGTKTEKIVERIGELQSFGIRL